MTRRRVLIAFLGLVVIGLQVRLWIGEGSLAHAHALAERAETQRLANESKIQRNKVLRAEIKDLKNGFDAIEEKARSEFGMIKEGETFFLLVEKPRSP
ncbi:MAG: septum formation initiator family protein [Pseudomonadales bacterium]